MSETEAKAMGRREFLRKAGAGAGAAGAAAVAAVAGGTEQASAADGSAKPAGYRETEHVKRYYAVAARF